MKKIKDRIKIPADLLYNSEIRKLCLLTGESPFATIGRMVLLVDWCSKRSSTICKIEELNEVVHWRCFDPWWFEVMEKIGFGHVHGTRFKLTLPPEWDFKTKNVLAAMAGAHLRKAQDRDGKGKFVNGKNQRR